ncbi:MAG: hypothetical protein IMW89_22960, partial [Ktedonobacteraceae bacterium]|nr:hypothetical protein [Ktedonobacteraceae bacterium]
MSVHIFGIRHHGPGCARALRAALQELQPDIVLVEGPPDAHAVLPLLTHEQMRPPVALLIYRPDSPGHAVYYPFTIFSPEWQALHYALHSAIPVRFMDLPQALWLAQQPATEPTSKTAAETEPAKEQEKTSPAQEVATPVIPDQEQTPEQQQERLHSDPLALLAEAAGYTDHELW